MSNDIATYKLSDMQVMADSVARSGLFGMKTPEQALALMLVAQAEGQHPATITQDYDIIQGKACRKTHSVLARFQQMGGSIEWLELTDQVARAELHHPKGGELVIEWTIEQAKKAGLTNKDNWRNYPRAMLRARVIAEGVRAIYPAAIGGMLVAEEAEDIGKDKDKDKQAEPRDMGAAERVDPRAEEKPPCEQKWLEDKLPKLRARIDSGATNLQGALNWITGMYSLTPQQAEQAMKALDTTIEGEFKKESEVEQ